MDLAGCSPYFIYVYQLLLLITEAKSYPTYVSESPSPTGVKALFTYLDNEKGSLKGGPIPLCYYQL